MRDDRRGRSAVLEPVRCGLICAWRKMVVGEQRQIVFGRSISGKVIDPAGFGVLSMKNPVVPAPFAFVLSNR